MSSSLLRPLRAEDAAAVAALFVRVYGDARRLDPQEIQSWLDNDALEPELLRVLERDGEVVGYGDLWVEEDAVALDAAAPGCWEPFFAWAEAVAAARDISSVRFYVPEGHEAAGLVQARGYRLWRSSFTMEIELTEPPGTPGLPEGIAVRPYRAGIDTDALRAALNESFADDPFFHEVSPANFTAFYVKARGFDPALWLLAWDDDELAGFALSYPERAGDRSMGWVGTLGVRPAWRRRGLGEGLLRLAFASLYAGGLRRVGLGVDTENVTGALRLYERAGMRAVRRFDTWALELP